MDKVALMDTACRAMEREAELATECARLRVVMMRVFECNEWLAGRSRRPVWHSGKDDACVAISGLLNPELFDGNDAPRFDALGWPNTPESPQWICGEEEGHED